MKNQTLQFDSVKSFKRYLEKLQTLPNDINRKVDYANFLKIKNSVLTLGVQREINTVKTSVFGGGMQEYIIDGQHLVKAILDLDDSQIEGGMSVRINQSSSQKEIIKLASTLNQVGRKWTLLDYLNSWSNTGDENYLRLSKIQKEYGVSLNPLIELFYGNDGGNIVFKRGDFEFLKHEAEEILDLWKEGIELGIKRKSSFLSALARLSNKPCFSIKKCRKRMLANTFLLTQNGGRDKFIKILQN